MNQTRNKKKDPFVLVPDSDEETEQKPSKSKYPLKKKIVSPISDDEVEVIQSDDDFVSD